MHAALESKQDFSHWVRNRVEQCDLVENEDYGVSDKFIENLQGGRPRKEYWVTLDAAKEISLMEGTARGKEMRRYFIGAEKRWRASLVAPALPDLQNPDVLLRLVNQYSGELLESMEKAKFNEEEATPISPPSDPAQRLLQDLGSNANPAEILNARKPVNRPEAPHR